MSTIASDLIGEVRGHLTVTSFSKKIGKSGQTYLFCKCKCGKKTEVRVDNFLSGHTYSCGCRQKKVNKENRVNIVISNKPTKNVKLSEDSIQSGMKRRRIEELQAKFALERELSLDIY